MSAFRAVAGDYAEHELLPTSCHGAGDESTESDVAGDREEDQLLASGRGLRSWVGHGEVNENDRGADGVVDQVERLPEADCVGGAFAQLCCIHARNQSANSRGCHLIRPQRLATVKILADRNDGGPCVAGPALQEPFPVATASDDSTGRIAFGSLRAWPHT